MSKIPTRWQSDVFRKVSLAYADRLPDRGSEHPELTGIHTKYDTFDSPRSESDVIMPPFGFSHLP